jgi:hypothetical protein
MISPQYPRRHKHRRPYWNFYRVVLAGWIIRYPKIVFLPIGFLIVLIYNAIVN